MWPLTGAVIAQVCDLALSKDQDETFATRSFSAVLTGHERTARPEDVVFAITDQDGTLVRSGARAGALVVAPLEHEARTHLQGEAGANVVLVPSPLRCLRALARYIRAQLRCPVVAVAGSNGKTTTKEMIAAVLSGRGTSRVTHTPGTNNGWLGIPITLCHPLHRSSHPPDAVVVEIGIDALGAMEHHLALVRPDVAVISALGPEHVEGLGTTDKAVEEELRLFDTPGARRVWMLEDDVLHRRASTMAHDEDVLVAEAGGDVSSLPGRSLSYRVVADALADGAGGASTRLSLTPRGGEPFEVEVPLPGLHNARNAALACGVGVLLGLSSKEISDGFARFRPLEQRCATVPLPGDCLLIDDTYNASPKSMQAALAMLGGIPRREHVAILGEMLELGAESVEHHLDLARRLLEGRVRHVFLVGEEMLRVHEALLTRADRFASLSWAKADAAPEALVDWPHWDGCAVLVKGSRGVRMERYVASIAARQRARGASSARARTLVVGLSRAAVAHQLRRRFGREDQCSVHVLDSAALLRGEHLRMRVDTLVLAGFEPASEDNVEEELALLAQPLLTLAAPARVLAYEIREDVALALRQVMPPGVRWLAVRAGEELPFDGPPSVLGKSEP